MGWNFASLSPSSLLGNLVQLLEWIQDDILTWGGNVDAANNGLTNSQFVVLNPGALVGATYTVTSASWSSTSGGQITYGFSAGTFEIQPNQYVTISGATSGYNFVMAAVVSSTTTSIVVAAPSNPGSWGSGGTILVGGMSPASGMIQSDPSGNLWANSNGTYGGWTQQTTTIDTLGGNLDGAAYGINNLAFVQLNPGALTGATFTVTAASWASSVATYTIGTHTLAVGQLISLTGASPSGWNVTLVPVTAVASTTFSIAQSSNPGTWTSGGTVQADGSPASAGMLNVDPSGYFRVYSGSAWGVNFKPNVGIGTASPSYPLHVVTATNPAISVQASSAAQPAIVLQDGAGTPNVWYLLSGVTSTTDGTFAIYSGNNSAAYFQVSNAGAVGIEKTVGTYNGITTAGAGMAIIAADVNNSAGTYTSNQSGTVFAVPSGQKGWYRVSLNCMLTRVATSSSTLPTTSINFTNGVNGTTQLTPLSFPIYSASSNNGYAQSYGTFTFYAQASTNITFAQTGYASSGATSMDFGYQFLVEYLGI
jgi:hypothetical protein